MAIATSSLPLTKKALRGVIFKGIFLGLCLQWGTYVFPSILSSGGPETSSGMIPLMEDFVVRSLDRTASAGGGLLSLDTSLWGAKERVVDFERHEGVVIVTKIHDFRSVGLLKQSLCLLTYAYNNRPKYDIVVFSTETIPQRDQQQVKALAAPAKVTFVLDNPGLHQMVRALNPKQQQYLFNRCNVSSVEELNWYLKCKEKLHGRERVERLGYGWQAEFRSYHLWKHPSLAPYKWMMWLDADAFCGKVWDVDPVAVMIRNDLVLLFANFPAGQARGPHFKEIYLAAFDRNLCKIYMKDGHLQPIFGPCNAGRFVYQIHGFMHITNLDFYRSPPVTKWTEALISDSKFSRERDDQMAVTVPAAVFAPERSWRMRDHNVSLNVVHNARFDGKDKAKIGDASFVQWYYWKGGKEAFPEVQDKCPITEGQ